MKFEMFSNVLNVELVFIMEILTTDFKRTKL